MRVVFYKDRKDEWRWRAIGGNGRILADSGEGYKRRRNALRGMLRAYYAMATGKIEGFGEARRRLTAGRG